MLLRFPGHCEGTGLTAGQGPDASGKHTCMLTARRESRQLNEVQLQVLRGFRKRRSEASGAKSFS